MIQHLYKILFTGETYPEDLFGSALLFPALLFTILAPFTYREPVVRFRVLLRNGTMEV